MHHPRSEKTRIFLNLLQRISVAIDQHENEAFSVIGHVMWKADYDFDFSLFKFSQQKKSWNHHPIYLRFLSIVSHMSVFLMTNFRTHTQTQLLSAYSYWIELSEKRPKSGIWYISRKRCQFCRNKSDFQELQESTNCLTTAFVSTGIQELI